MDYLFNRLSIPDSNNNMKSFYSENFIIPINSLHTLHILEYYENMPYFYRDFYTETGFNHLISGVTINKPVSFKIYNKNTHYIPNEPKGRLCKYEIIPKKVEKYNIIKTEFFIKELYIFGEPKFNKNQKIIKIKYMMNSKNNDLQISMIIDTFNAEYNIYRWIPINNKYISGLSETYIDISDFINKDNNFLLILRG